MIRRSIECGYHARRQALARRARDQRVGCKTRDAQPDVAANSGDRWRSRSLPAVEQARRKLREARWPGNAAPARSLRTAELLDRLIRASSARAARSSARTAGRDVVVIGERVKIGTRASLRLRSGEGIGEARAGPAVHDERLTRDAARERARRGTPRHWRCPRAPPCGRPRRRWGARSRRSPTSPRSAACAPCPAPPRSRARAATTPPPSCARARAAPPWPRRRRRGAAPRTRPTPKRRPRGCRPHPRSRQRAAAARATYQCCSRFTRKSRCQVASSISSSGAQLALPTMLITVVSPPSSASARAIARSAERGSVTSATSGTAWHPRSASSRATARARSSTSSTSATRAPALASRSAVARPIPWPAPITAAALPARVEAHAQPNVLRDRC